MTDYVNQLADQLDFHWTSQLRPRLDGLTDEEYCWRPVSNCRTVHRDGRVDFEHPAPEPTPFTTIAWRLAHVIVGVLAMRSHSHFAGPAADSQRWQYATGAATALRQRDEAYRMWMAGVRALTEDKLRRPCGPAEGPYAEHPFSELILYINREMIHHGAEIACIRDLYANTTEKKEK